MGDDLVRPASPAGPEPAEAGLAAETPGLSLETTVLEQDFDVSSLYALRSAVAAHAAAAGLTGNRLYDVVTTAHELAANAVRHGAGHGRLVLRLADGALYCVVSDDGAKVTETDSPGADGVWREQHGHGLWVVGQVADQFTIQRSGGATTATAVFSLDVRPDPADQGRG